MSLAALLGISFAETTPMPLIGFAVGIALALLALLRKSTATTYCFVAAGFFLLHSLRQTESRGVRLA
ncbi:MAG: hypothetical protein ACRECQ_17490, partial [Burkholderiaceae bacterium]